MKTYRLVEKMDQVEVEWKPIPDSPDLNEEELENVLHMLMHISVPMNMDYKGSIVMGMLVGSDQKKFISFEEVT